MRVLHLYAGNLYGGIERLLVTMARYAGLCPSLQPSFLLCFEGRLADELRACGATVHMSGPVRLSRPWTVWRARQRFGRLLERHPFDAVVCHACWSHVVFAPVVRSRGLPLVFWAHDMLTGRHWLERWARRIDPHLVLTNSRFTQGTVPTLFPHVRSELCYHPVAPPDAEAERDQRGKVRAALGAPANEVVLIMASRLERWKGHALLLSALSLLRETPNWSCWIAGGVQRHQEAAYLAELQDSVARTGLGDRVRFLGQRSDVGALMAAADVYCQPNTRPEPFGIAFVEALHAGLPVVTTAMGGVLEIVDRTCGILVPPGDPRQLADALHQLIADQALRTHLGDGGPVRARQLCDPVESLRRMQGLLASLPKEQAVCT